MIAAVFRSKTIWFAIALAVMSVLQGFVMHLPISPAGQALVGSVVAAIIVVLRFVTTMPLDQK